MTTAPEVLYLRGDQFFSDIDRAWDARTLRPLVPEPPAVPPLAHRGGCWMAPWPDLAPLADLCSCTAAQRYLRGRREVTS